MKMTGLEVVTATEALAGIINRPRALPQTAQYRISRLHAALEPEYKLLAAQRTKLVDELGEEMYSKDDPAVRTGWGIPDESPNMPIFLERWKAILAIELEMNVQPLTLASLGNETNGITAAEIGWLGQLISE